MYDTGEFLVNASPDEADEAALELALDDPHAAVLLPRKYGWTAYVLDPTGSDKFGGLRFRRIGGYEWSPQAELACRKAGSRLVLRIRTEAEEADLAATD